MGQFIIPDSFNNLKYIKNVRCPIFLLHGRSDNMVSYNHSEELFGKLKIMVDAANCKVELVCPRGMTHTGFDLEYDLLEPLQRFFQKIGLKLEGKNNQVEIDDIFFGVEPPEFRNDQNSIYLTTR